MARLVVRIALAACPNPFLLSPTAHWPQSLLYVGKALLDAGHEVQVLDFRARRRLRPGDIPDCDILGVTATSPEMWWAEQLADMARAKGIVTMVGGPHATYMPDDCRTHFDLIVRGDGEKAVLGAVEAREPGVFESPLPDLAGVFPAWELIGRPGFSRELFTGQGYGQGPLAAGVHTSRGCPYACSFCREGHVPVRFRPVVDVVQEVTELAEKWHVKSFRFYDDCMTLNPQRFFELCREFKRLGIQWRAHSRSNLWTDEIAEAAREGGCRDMGFGFESADDAVLKACRKHETVDQHREAVRVCKRHGIKCHAFWMTSLPGETWDSIHATQDFMLQEKPDRWIVSNLAPYPGSDIWAHPEAYGVTWMEKDFTRHFNFSDEPLIEYEGVSRQELKEHYGVLKHWLGVNFPHG